MKTEILEDLGFKKEDTWTYSIPTIGNRKLIVYVGTDTAEVYINETPTGVTFPCKTLSELKDIYKVLTNKDLPRLENKQFQEDNLKQLVEDNYRLAMKTRDSYEQGTPMRAHFDGMAEAFLLIFRIMGDYRED